MGIKITNEKFLETISEYEKVLEKEYLAKVDKAFDKDYTADFFQKSLFIENELVPYTTVLFMELLFTFEHYTKVSALATAYEETFAEIERIRSLTEITLSKARMHLDGDTKTKLPNVYYEYIESGTYDLAELIQIEEQVAKFTDENISGALAIHLAGANLFEKYRDEVTGIEGLQQTKGDFTLNERTLALYYLLASLGFKKGLNEDRTALASIYHLIMDKNFNNSTKVKNSNIYKSLGSVPNVVKDKPKLNNYLKNIRPIFEKANMQEALELIDQAIKKVD
ncbi:MAG: hypothetical protein Crog4KO_14530 [Crocinitomicaceae bacterium]